MVDGDEIYPCQSVSEGISESTLDKDRGFRKERSKQMWEERRLGRLRSSVNIHLEEAMYSHSYHLWVPLLRSPASQAADCIRATTV